MLYRLIVILLALALAPVASARATDARVGARASVDGELERLRVEGFNRLYSLEYDAAGTLFTEMIRIAPERPEGYLFRATNTWFGSLFNKRLLSTNLYARDEFYEQKEQAVDPAVDKSFRADLEKAIALGEARVAADPKDLDALYYLGAAHGSLAGYEGSMARAFMSALKHGSKSVDLHERVIERDPLYVDAYLTIGMYHYVVGSLPLPVKLLAAVGGVRGSKKNGLAELERVVREGRRNADDARVVLVGLYAREGRREDALALLRELEARYPSNYVLALEEANTLAQLGRRDEAYAAFERLLATPRATAKAKDFVEYWYAEALRAGGEHQRALERYAGVWQWKGADADLMTLSRLGAGQCLDALGRREEAVASYQIVRGRPDILDSRKKAERFLKTAYSPSQPMASTGQTPRAS
jgi:tetratricopeptide (TPR) repeat protein